MFLVFDIGGTNTRMGVSENGNTLKKVVKWATGQEFQESMAKIKTETTALVGEGEVEGVGVGIAGILDKSRGSLLRSPHLLDWVNKPLGMELEALFETKNIRVENDAAMAAVGEANVGAGKGYEIVAYLTFSTGVGGARVIRGRIDDRGYGFEPGHQILSAENSEATWENLVSGTALWKKYSKKPETIRDGEVWNREAELLSVGIHNVIVMWSPGVVVLGGGVMRSVDVQTVKKLLEEKMIIYPTLPEIKKAELGDTAGLIGALEFLKR